MNNDVSHVDVHVIVLHLQKLGGENCQKKVKMSFFQIWAKIIFLEEFLLY